MVLVAVSALTAWPTAAVAAKRRPRPPAVAARATPPHSVLVISIDGLPWRLLRQLGTRLPHLDGLRRRGDARPLRPVLPSLTWPGHVSMLTGVHPPRHGVVGNRFWDRRSGRTVQLHALTMAEAVSATSVTELVAAVGGDVAAISWPATSGAAHLRWNLPEVPTAGGTRHGASAGWLERLQRQGVDLGGLDAWAQREGEELDALSVAATSALLGDATPRLTLVHLLAYDAAAHRHGPTSRQALAALEACDRRVGALLAAFAARGLDAAGSGAAALDVVVVSDHGFHEVHDGLAPSRALRRAGLDADERGALQVVANGQALFFYLRAPAPPAGAPAAAAARYRHAQQALDKALRHLRRDGRVERVLAGRALQRAGWAPRGADSRLPDAIALLRPRVMAHEPRQAHRERRPRWRGMHGGNPDAPDMQAVWLHVGPCARRGRGAAALRMVDVAPTLAAMLGLRFEGPIDGRRSKALAAGCGAGGAAGQGGRRR